MRGCFAENRHVVFSWKLSVKEHMTFRWSGLLRELVMSRKTIKDNTTDSERRPRFALQRLTGLH